MRNGSLNEPGVSQVLRLEVNPTPCEQARSKVHELRPINKSRNKSTVPVQRNERYEREEVHMQDDIFVCIRLANGL